MKILLIQFQHETIRDPAVPIGLCYIAAVLKDNGHEVRIYDPNITPVPLLEALPGELGKDAYDFVGISLRNIDNNEMHRPFYYYLELPTLLECIKSCLPDVKIMIGGTGFSIFSETIMNRHKQLDFGFYLEAVESIVEFFDDIDHPEKVRGLYYRKNGEVKFTGRREYSDLNKLPSDPWRHVNVDDYRNLLGGVGVVSKTGCIFRCAYCTYPQLSGSKFSYRSAEKIVDDIELLVNKYKIESVQFIDSIFNYPEKHALDVCNEIIRRGIKIIWSAYFVEKFFTKELCEAAVKSGCFNFSFSPDGIDDATMKSLGKISREKDLLRSVEIIKEVPGAHATYGFFMNAPEQSFGGFIKLIKFFIKTKLLHGSKFLSISAWYPRIYPGTALHDYLVKTYNFPAETDKLLPLNIADLRELFWINPENAYINYFFGLVVLRGKIKDALARKRLLGAGGRSSTVRSAPSH